MDENRFDQVVTSLGEKGSRRGVLGVLAATLGVGGLALLGQDDAAARKKGGKKRRRNKDKQSPPPPASPPPPPASPPPPPVPNRSLMQDCTPGVDICTAGLECNKPTNWQKCHTEGHTNWYCVPVGGACNSNNCECCQDDPDAPGEYGCFNGVCEYRP